jgi:hypothetical protein
MKLSKIELETLLLLANRGPLTGYDMHSKKRSDGSGKKADTNIMSEPYWIKLRRKLVKLKMIEKFPEEGRRKPYIIGENAFDYLIQDHMDKIYDFENFVKCCEDYFSLVFGFWSDLKAYGLADYVKNSLSGMIYEIYFDIKRDLVLGKRKTYSHEEFIRDLYARIYIPDLFSEPDEIEKNVPFKKIKEFRKKISAIKSFVQERVDVEENEENQKIRRLKRVRMSLNN